MYYVTTTTQSIIATRAAAEPSPQRVSAWPTTGGQRLGKSGEVADQTDAMAMVTLIRTSSTIVVRAYQTKTLQSQLPGPGSVFRARSELFSTCRLNAVVCSRTIVGPVWHSISLLNRTWLRTYTRLSRLRFLTQRDSPVNCTDCYSDVSSPAGIP